MTANFKPAGYHTVTPYLSVRRADEAIEYYKRAFGAEEIFRMSMPDGTIGHAEIRIGDSTIMLADESEEWGNLSPDSLGGTASGLMIYVEDVDAVFKLALDEGGAELMPVADQFYGDRSGQLRDPFGHKWTIATHIEEIEPDEMERRMQEAFGAQG